MRDTARVKVIKAKEGTPKCAKPVNPCDNIWAKITIRVAEDLSGLSNVSHGLADASIQHLSSLDHVFNRGCHILP